MSSRSGAWNRGNATSPTRMTGCVSSRSWRDRTMIEVLMSNYLTPKYDRLHGPLRALLDDTMTDWRRERPDLEFDGDGHVPAPRPARCALAIRGIDEAVRRPRASPSASSTCSRRCAAPGAGTDPHARRPSRRVAMVSPAGMTNRLDRLERAGLVYRATPTRHDRRGSLVTLTPDGHASPTGAIEDLVAAEAARRRRRVRDRASPLRPRPSTSCSEPLRRRRLIGGRTRRRSPSSTPATVRGSWTQRHPPSPLAYAWPLSVAPGEPVALHAAGPAVPRGRDRRPHRRAPRRRLDGRVSTSSPTPIPATPRRTDAAGRPRSRSRSARLAQRLLRGRARDRSRAASRTRRSRSSWSAASTPDPDRPLLALCTNTYNAYNDFGGRNLYEGGTQVSFLRPLAKGLLRKPAGPGEPRHRARPARSPASATTSPTCVSTSSPSGAGRHGWPNYELGFVRWAERNGYDLDYAVNADLEDPATLADRRAVPLGGSRRVLVGADARHGRGLHPRRRQRAVPLRQHRRSGRCASTDDGADHGRVQGPLRAGPGVRHRPPGRAHVDVVRPPGRAAGEHDDRRELRPRRLPPHRADRRVRRRRVHGLPTRTTGSSTGTDATYGDLIGRDSVIVGYECDGCDFTIRDGVPTPDGLRRHAGRLPHPRASRPAEHFDRTNAPRPPKGDAMQRARVHRVARVRRAGTGRRRRARARPLHDGRARARRLRVHRRHHRLGVGPDRRRSRRRADHPRT